MSVAGELLEKRFEDGQKTKVQVWYRILKFLSSLNCRLIPVGVFDSSFVLVSLTTIQGPSDSTTRRHVCLGKQT